MHEKPIDQLSLPPSKVITVLTRTEKTTTWEQEQGQTQHETPRSENHKVAQ